MDPFADLFEQPKKKPSVKNPKAAQSSDPFADLFEDVQSPIAKQTEPLPKPTITPPQTGAVGFTKSKQPQIFGKDIALESEDLSFKSYVKTTSKYLSSFVGGAFNVLNDIGESILSPVGSGIDKAMGVERQDEDFKLAKESAKKLQEYGGESFVSDLFSALGSSAPFALLGGATGARVATASAGLKAGVGAVQSIPESLAEAKQTYETAKEKGFSPKVAVARSVGTFLANEALNTGTFMIGFGAKPTSKVKDFFKEYFSNIVQENAQQVIQNVATDSPILQGLAETTAISAIISAPSGLINVTSKDYKQDPVTNPGAMLKTLADNEATTDQVVKIISTFSGTSPDIAREKLDAIIATNPELAKQFEENDKKVIDKIAEDVMAKIPESIATENIDDFQQFQDETVDIDLDGADITTDTISTPEGFQGVITVTKDGQETKVTLNTKYPTAEQAQASAQKISESVTTEETPAFKKKEGDMFALRNIPEENIQKILQTKGMPAPSIAITKKGVPFADFGDVTLVGDKNLVKPGKDTQVYAGDIYSPTTPRPTYGIDFSNLNEAYIDNPVDYFEAKIMRAVGFEEFKGALIPKTASDNSKQALIDSGLRVVEYDPSIEGDRQSKLESEFKDFAFQKKQTSQKLIDRKEAVKQIVSYLNRLGIDLEVNFVDSIITPDNVAAYGAYLDGTINFEQFITDTTVVHEIGHAIFRNLDKIPLFKGITRAQLMREARAKYQKEGETISDYDLEERIMDDLENYVKEVKAQKPSTFTGKIREFFAKLYKGLTQMFTTDTRSQLQKFYETIETGVATERVRLPTRGELQKYLRGDTIDFRKKGIEVPAFTTQKNVSLETIQNEYDAIFKKKDDTFSKAELDKLKTGIKGRVQGEKVGIKLGKKEQLNIDTIKIEDIKRKAELDKLKRAITRRSYVTQALNAIRKNIPPAERFEYMSALAEIGRSGSLAEYNHLYDRVMERAEQIAIEKGERKIMARKRSTIAYLKMINDLSDKLIKDVKSTLDIKKPITQMSQEELDRVLNEVKNRINFLKENNLIPNPQPKEMTKDDYLAIAQEKSTSRFLKGIKTFATDVFDMARSTFITIGERLKSVSPEMYFALETMVFDTNKYLNDVARPKIESFESMMDKLKKVDPKLEVAVKGALMSQRYDIAEQILSENGVDPKPLNEIKKLFDDIFNKLKSVGVDVDYLENFFPRYLTSSARESILAEANTNLKQAVQEKMADVGRELNQKEKATLYANYFRGFEFGSKILLSDGRFGESREVATLTDREMIDRYESLSNSLIQYVTQANNLYQSRKFFNKFDPKFIDTVKNGDFEEGINAFVEKLGADKLYTGQQLKEIQTVLQTYFKTVNLTDTEKGLMTFAYVQGLGNLTSFITQALEAGVNTVMNMDRALINPAAGFSIKPEEAYIDASFDIRDNPVGKMAEYLTVPMKVGDQIGVIIGINQYYQVLRKLAQKNDPMLRKTVEYIYGKDNVDSVMQTLAQAPENPAKGIPDEANRLIFTQMSDYRVVSRLGKSETFINHPLWGVFRSFTVKQITNIIKMGNAEIREGIRTKQKGLFLRGVRRKALLVAALLIMNASGKALRDLIRNNKVDGVEDYVLDSFFGLFGLNRYGFQNMSRNGFANVLYQTVAPAPLAIPAGIVESIIRDVSKGEAKTLERIPGAGEIIKALKNRRLI